MNQHSATVHPRMARGSVLAWLVWGCAALFYLYEYVLRVSPSVMTEELMRDLRVSCSALGILVSCYYYAYVPLQIPCGVIVDRLGPRCVITVSALLCSIGSYWFAISDTLATAQVARFLIGAGSACAYIACMKVAANWFSKEWFALLAGITMMMGTLGGLLGGSPLAALVQKSGWRGAMIILAVIGACVTSVCALLIRNHPTREKHTQPAESSTSLFSGIKYIGMNPQNWLIGLYGALMYVPISAIAELWGVPYLMRLYHIDSGQASLTSAMIFVGMALGSPLGAALSNTLKSRKKIMSGAAAASFLTLLPVIYYPEIPLWAAGSILFLSGLFCGGQILYFAVVREINPEHYSATAIGFTNALIMVSGIIFQPLLGAILDFAWDGQISATGLPFYTLHDYQQALTTVPICLILAFVVMRYIKESYPQPDTQNAESTAATPA